MRTKLAGTTRKFMLTLAMISSLFTQTALASDTCDKALAVWSAMSRDDQAELLTFDLLVPEVFTVVTYSDYKTDFDLSKITNAEHLAFIQKMIETFENEVSTEEIEQSEYQANGEPEVSELYLLVSSNGQILGGKIAFFQDGLDQEGEPGDINWRASLRVNADADVFRSEAGTEYDDLYFEWSGH